MKKRKHKIDFPEAKGNYWYLFWIGKVRYSNKQRKVDFYFYNKCTPTDTLKDLYYDSCIIKSVPVSYLAEYGIGSIYNVSEKILETIELNNHYTAKIDGLFRMTQNEFPLNGNEYFIQNSQKIVEQGFKYLKVYGKNRFNNGRCILVSPYTIIQYLFFYNDKLIKKAFAGELLYGFSFDKMKISQKEEAGKKIAELYYDASKLTKAEAVILSPYLFIKNRKGINFIESIYSHVLESFLNSQKDQASAYLKISWEFEDYSLSTYGKELYVKTADKKNIDYLLAYGVSNFIFHKQAYTVDEIKLFPFNSRDSTKDRENHDPIDVKGYPLPETQGLLLDLTRDSVNNGQAIETINSEFQNPFQLPVTIAKRQEQNEAYNVFREKDKNDIDAVTREVENLSEFADAVRENINNLIIKIGNFRYFKEVLKILKDDFLSKDSNFVLKQFDGAEISLPYQFVEIGHSGRYMYFVEFGNGFIGVFNEINNKSISAEKLFMLGSGFNDRENEIRNMLETRILWTYIRNVYSIHYLSKGIIIQLGAKHERPKEEDGKMVDEDLLISFAAYRTAKKLYEQRILNNIL